VPVFFLQIPTKNGIITYHYFVLFGGFGKSSIYPQEIKDVHKTTLMKRNITKTTDRGIIYFVRNNGWGDNSEDGW